VLKRANQAKNNLLEFAIELNLLSGV